MIKINPTPSHRHDAPERIALTAAVGDSVGAEIRVEIGTGVVGPGVCTSGVLGAGVEVDEGLGTTGMGVRLTKGDGVVLAVSLGKGVSPPASAVEVGKRVAGLVPVTVAGAGDEVFVGWVVCAGGGEAVGSGPGVSEGSPGGSVGLLVGGCVVGPSVGGTVGTPDGVSVGMV